LADTSVSTVDADQEILRLLRLTSGELFRDDALKIEPYANAVSILANAIAQQKIQVTKPHENLEGEQYRQIVPNHPVYKTLQNPFTYCTRSRLFKKIAVELLIENEAFIQVTGKKLRVAEPGEFYLKDNRIVRRSTDMSPRGTVIPILLDETPSYTQLTDALRLWNLVLAQRTTFFKGDAKSGTLITFKGTEDSNITEDNLFALAKQVSVSVKEKAVTVVPEIEAAIHKLNNDPDTQLFDATTETVLRAVARQFGISAARLGDTKSTRVTTDVKAAEVSLRASLRPYSTAIEEALTCYFFPKEDLQICFVKHDDDPMESSTVQTRLILNGIATIDEIRSLNYNLPPLPDGKGAEPILPGQQIIKDEREGAEPTEGGHTTDDDNDDDDETKTAE
jgi:hypothetical protein